MNTAIFEMNAMEQFFKEIFKNPVIDPIDTRVSHVLKQLGIRPHIKGYRYLKDAIRITMSNPKDVEMITKSLYPMVAKKNNSTASRVERAIRHAIKDISQVDEFRRTIFLGIPKNHYTNKEFITGIAEYLMGFEKVS